MLRLTLHTGYQCCLHDSLPRTSTQDRGRIHQKKSMSDNIRNKIVQGRWSSYLKEKNSEMWKTADHPDIVLQILAMSDIMSDKHLSNFLLLFCYIVRQKTEMSDEFFHMFRTWCSAHFEQLFTSLKACNSKIGKNVYLSCKTYNICLWRCLYL